MEVGRNKIRFIDRKIKEEDRDTTYFQVVANQRNRKKTSKNSEDKLGHRERFHRVRAE